jgi:hypothetical protein
MNSTRGYCSSPVAAAPLDSLLSILAAHNIKS